VQVKEESGYFDEIRCNKNEGKLAWSGNTVIYTFLSVTCYKTGSL